MSDIDFTPIVTAATDVVGMVVMVVGPVLVMRAIKAFEARTGIQLTDQQNAVLANEVSTAAGLLMGKVSAGVLKVSDVHVNNEAGATAVNGVLGRAFDTVNQLGVTKQDVAEKIVAATMKMVSADPTISTIQAQAPAAPVKDTPNA
jgi:hypothetical protein